MRYAILYNCNAANHNSTLYTLSSTLYLLAQSIPDIALSTRSWCYEGWNRQEGSLPGHVSVWDRKCGDIVCNRNVYAHHQYPPHSHSRLDIYCISGNHYRHPRHGSVRGAGRVSMPWRLSICQQWAIIALVLAVIPSHRHGTTVEESAVVWLWA